MQLKCLISSSELQQLIFEQLDEFYSRRVKKLSGLKLRDTLARKNPYLFRAIGVSKASEIVEGMLKAYISSSDEGIFGEVFFEPIAKSICGRSSYYSGSYGVDIGLEDEHVFRAIAIKSGKAGYNSQSKKKQVDQFNDLRSRLRKNKKVFEAIVGYGYGRKNKSKGNFREIAGQTLWEELTGDPEFYLKLIDLMDHRPQEHRPTYEEEFGKAMNRFVREFTEEFCTEDGSIRWEELVKFNSGKESPKRPSKKAKKVKG
jgi:hypothetical protein